MKAQSGNLWHVVADGRVISSHDRFPLHARLVIDAANTLRYRRAGDKGSIYLVEQPLE